MKKQNDKTDHGFREASVFDKFTNAVASPVLLAGHLSISFGSLITRPFSEKLSDQLESKANTLIMED